MDLQYMDPATAKLAIEMSLSDIDDLLESLYNNDPLPDDQRVGLETMRKDMQDKLNVLEGQVLALRMLKEEHDNRVAFAKLCDEEEIAIADHQLALRLHGQPDCGPAQKVANTKKTKATASRTSNGSQRSSSTLIPVTSKLSTTEPLRPLRPERVQNVAGRMKYLLGRMQNVSGSVHNVSYAIRRWTPRIL